MLCGFEEDQAFLGNELAGVPQAVISSLAGFAASRAWP